jgi:hypothetical protein
MLNVLGLFAGITYSRKYALDSMPSLLLKYRVVSVSAMPRLVFDTFPINEPKPPEAFSPSELQKHLA